jgi:HD-GYP domain-containing protein (c-di-GMP phosphodiesterase class II)
VLAGHASVALVNAGLYEAQRREAESAKALLELSRELSSGTQLKEVVDRIARGAARILGVKRTSVWLPAADGTGLVCRSAWSEDDATGNAQPGDRLSAAASELFSFRTEPFTVGRTDYEHVVGDDFPGELADAYAVVPIILDTGWAALALALDGENDLDERQLELLAGIAGQARMAITNALSFEGLERTFLSTVEALANALEAKDEYTSSHARWIRDMALKVGEEMGLDPLALKRVELGALFHDIGKIGIPASILTKPGPLTAEERVLIETHPELGERILAPIEQLEHVRPIVRACHERFDGKGYPDHLAGDEIPLEARIIFVCDAFHAMTTTRPYREALPVEEAHRRLTEAAGSQFDPAIVDICIRLLEAPEAATRETG